MLHTKNSNSSSTNPSSENASAERRKHWRDRRAFPDRRNPERQRQTDFDCRSGIPRRASDVAGELAEGDIWWEDEDSQY